MGAVPPPGGRSAAAEAGVGLVDLRGPRQGRRRRVASITSSWAYLSHAKEHKRPQPRTVDIPHHTYQPTRAELNEDHRVDATFEEVVEAVLRPVKICYVKPAKRKR